MESSQDPTQNINDISGYSDDLFEEEVFVVTQETPPKKNSFFAQYGATLLVTGSIFTLVAIFYQNFIQPKPVVVEESTPEIERVELEAEEDDNKAEAALIRQRLRLEKESQQPIQVSVENPPQPIPEPIAQPAAPTPQPVAVRPQPRPQPRPQARPQPEPEDPYDAWKRLSQFSQTLNAESATTAQQPDSSAVALARRNTPATNQAPPNQQTQPKTLSTGEQGILARVPSRKLEPLPVSSNPNTLDLGAFKAKVQLPLVWDGNIDSPEQQQTDRLLLKTTEPIFDNAGVAIAPKGADVYAKVLSVSEGNGLVTAYVEEISYWEGAEYKTRNFSPQELIVRDKTKGPLIAKSNRKSGTRSRVIASSISTLNAVGEELIRDRSDSTTTISNGTTITSVDNSSDELQSRIAGAILQGVADPLLQEVRRRNVPDQIGDQGSIFTIKEGTTLFLTPVKPLVIN